MGSITPCLSPASPRGPTHVLRWGPSRPWEVSRFSGHPPQRRCHPCSTKKPRRFVPVLKACENVARRGSRRLLRRAQESVRFGGALMESGGWGAENVSGRCSETHSVALSPASRNHGGDGALTAFADGLLRDEQSGQHVDGRRHFPHLRRQQLAHEAREN